MISKSITFIFIFILSICLSSNQILADYSVYGEVYNSETSEPIPGATIRLVNTTKGTYTSSNGKFKFPFLDGNQKLKVSSLGYHSKTFNVTGNTDTLIVYLEPGTIMLQGVTKVGDIDVDEVIRRAISRKQENVEKLKTLQGVLYSKLVMELGGNVFESSSNSEGSSISITGTIGDKAPDKYQMFVMETFSDVKKDFETNQKHVEIKQRRQTSNMDPQNNLFAIGDFVNFYNNEIQFIKTTLTTPLSDDAFSFYDFEMLEKTMLDDRYIYVIKVIPDTRTYPVFEGTIKIVEKTYNLIEVDLKPSENTAITLLEDLHFIQKFSEIEPDIWFPTYLFVTAKSDIEILKGIMEMKIDVSTTSIYSDIKINEALPDYIYKDKFGYQNNYGFQKDSLTNEIDSTRRYRVNNNTLLTVAKMADSTDLSYWEKNSLREISEREKEMYRKVDSLVAIEDGENNEESSNWLPIDFSPYLDFNRVGSVSLGMYLDFGYDLASFSGLGYYSLGQQRPYGNISVKLNNLIGKLDLYGQVFSEINNISSDKKYPMILNTLFTSFLHTDYYDYLQKDGYALGASYRIFGIGMKAKFENSRNWSLEKTTNRSIFTDKLWRENPKIDEGDFNIASLQLNYGSFSEFGMNSDFQYEFNLEGRYGELTDGTQAFRTLEGSAEIGLPLLETGYNPIYLHLNADGGISSGDLPLQENFRMNNTYLIRTGISGFYTAPIAAYGGTEYWSANAEINLTDIWWRFLGLPTYDNRGLDLIIAGSSGRFFSNDRGYYLQTGKHYYNEIGFGLSRIPTFISNLVFLRFDARWGIGPLGSGEFGAGVFVSLPF